MIQLLRNIHIHVQNNNLYVFNITVFKKENWVSHGLHWDSKVLPDLSRKAEQLL